MATPALIMFLKRKHREFTVQIVFKFSITDHHTTICGIAIDKLNAPQNEDMRKTFQRVNYKKAKAQ